jgi:radical SAM protein with 4Fe4S-binding SPASM domain
MDYTEFPRMVHTPLSELSKWFYNRAGNIETVQCTAPLEMCDWLFEKAYISHRGDVILCCSDYHYEVVFGNVMRQPFKDIYNGESYNAYRQAHREHRGHEMPLCDRCNRIVQPGEQDADLRIRLSCVA